MKSTKPKLIWTLTVGTLRVRCVRLDGHLWVQRRIDSRWVMVPLKPSGGAWARLDCAIADGEVYKQLAALGEL